MDRLLLIVLTFMSTTAFAQFGQPMLFGKNGTDVIVITDTDFVKPLDIYDAPIAYSTRKLKSSYTGYCMEVQQGGFPYLTQNIGFTAKGNFDQETFNSFVSGTFGYLIKWYNQGWATGADAIAPTASHRPLIRTDFFGKVTIDCAGSGKRLDFVTSALSAKYIEFFQAISYSGADVYGTNLLSTGDAYNPDGNSLFWLPNAGSPSFLIQSRSNPQTIITPLTGARPYVVNLWATPSTMEGIVHFPSFGTDGYYGSQNRAPDLTQPDVTLTWYLFRQKDYYEWDQSGMVAEMIIYDAPIPAGRAFIANNQMTYFNFYGFFN